MIQKDKNRIHEELMSKWVGESEQNVKKLFQTARSNNRSVIFIDEVEALIPKRRSSGSTVMVRVVPQILAELEGVETKNANLLFIGATNEPWSIDPAALRPGRFDEKMDDMLSVMEKIKPSINREMVKRYEGFKF